ncbi:UNVERIFIED_CONTAM: hypothetical protein Sindi_1652500 [Sesamum indicum]
MKCDLVDKSGLTPSNMIHLESSKSCEEVRQKILGISWNENGIGYLPLGFCHVNRKSGAWKISLWVPRQLGNIIPETLLESETNILNGMNYNGWLQNLRIVLDFENQGYVLDKPLPMALVEGSSLEEHVAFEKWLEDTRKLRIIKLAWMSNDIQKQYDWMMFP